MRAIGLSLVLAAGLASPAAAQQWTQGTDPQVASAFNQMIGTYGYYCQAGNPQACQAVNYLQQQANLMMQSGYQCQMGDQQACNAYNQGYMQLSQDWQSFQMEVAQTNQQVPYGYDGMTHEQRMQAIHDFGVQNRQNWEAQQQLNDANHQRFLEMLRQ